MCRASETFTCNAIFAEGNKEQEPLLEELSTRIKDLEPKRGREKPQTSEQAVETLLLEEGVPKWMEKFGAALVHLFKNPEGYEGIKPIQFLANEVWCTMWDTKESYSTKFQQQAKQRQGNGNRNSQSQDSQPRKNHNLLVD